MRLPKSAYANTEASKIHDYLLSTAHAIGRFKSSFFNSLGYSLENREVLKADLLSLSAAGETRFGQSIAYGQKYEIRGILRGASGKYAHPYFRMSPTWL